MSVLATHPAPTRRAKLGRPRLARPRGGAPNSVVVTISVDAPGSPEGERVLTALRELVAAAGSVVLVPEEGRPATPGGLRLDPRSRIATRDGAPLELSR